MARLPLLLTLSRFALAPAFVAMLAWGPAFAPLAVAALASLSDFVDGRLARRLGATTPAGAALDVAADATFVLVSLTALAAAGLLSWLLPPAAAAALGALALRWRRRPEGSSGRRGLADRAGHWAGVCNYGAVLVASGVPLGWIAPDWLPAASRLVAALNLAPIALRALRRARAEDRA